MLKPIASWLAVALGLTGLASAQGAETLSEAELAAQLVAQFDRIHSPLGLGLIDVEGYSTQRQDEGFLLIIEGASVTGLVGLGDLTLSVVPQGDTLAIELLDAPQGARISPALAEAAALSWDQFSLSGAWSLELGAYLDLTFALEGLRGEAEDFSATWDSLSIEVQRSGERIRFAYQATPLRIALNRETPLLVELGALDWQGVRSGEGAAPGFTTLLNFVEIMRNSAKLLGTREAEAVARLNGALAAAWRGLLSPLSDAEQRLNLGGLSLKRGNSEISLAELSVTAEGENLDALGNYVVEAQISGLSIADSRGSKESQEFMAVSAEALRLKLSLDGLTAREGAAQLDRLASYYDGAGEDRLSIHFAQLLTLFRVAESVTLQVTLEEGRSAYNGASGATERSAEALRFGLGWEDRGGDLVFHLDTSASGVKPPAEGTALQRALMPNAYEYDLRIAGVDLEALTAALPDPKQDSQNGASRSGPGGRLRAVQAYVTQNPVRLDLNSLQFTTDSLDFSATGGFVTNSAARFMVEGRADLLINGIDRLLALAAEAQSNDSPDDDALAQSVQLASLINAFGVSSDTGTQFAVQIDAEGNITINNIPLPLGLFGF